MFLDRKEGKKLHKGSVLVGYDLGEQYSQISPTGYASCVL